MRGVERAQLNTREANRQPLRGLLDGHSVGARHAEFLYARCSCCAGDTEEPAANQRAGRARALGVRQREPARWVPACSPRSRLRRGGRWQRRGTERQRRGAIHAGACLRCRWRTAHHAARGGSSGRRRSDGRREARGLHAQARGRDAEVVGEGGGRVPTHRTGAPTPRAPARSSPVKPPTPGSGLVEPQPTRLPEPGRGAFGGPAVRMLREGAQLFPTDGSSAAVTARATRPLHSRTHRPSAPSSGRPAARCPAPATSARAPHVPPPPPAGPDPTSRTGP